MIDAGTIIENNYALKADSFLYYLQERRLFHKDALKQLCESIYAVAEENVHIARTAGEINYIYGAILKCFLYHFDADDPYKITNMPENYNRMIRQLEKCVKFYFDTRVSA